ncbi:MAG: hypothetical protein LBS54_03360 [Dysgonamonadaceae bacterium]|jgi:hypothetical protein|nr:hypothetical protein [Dysgonamonadaceae bacterium]
MKNILFLAIISLSACTYSVRETIEYQVNEPVFMSESVFRNSVKVSKQPKQINSHGKICFYQGFLFISEPEAGIHIIDNNNPASPVSVGFIELIGNADIAVQDDRLYADALIDLVWFDISNPTDPKLEGRLENVFPEALPPVNNNMGCETIYNADGSRKPGIVVRWKLKTKEITAETYVSQEYEVTNTTGYSRGINGSMSKFALYADHLYAASGSNMEIFDLKSGKPEKAFSGTLPYLYQVETMFSYKDNLFLGMPSGMVIYSLKNPVKPKYCSIVLHIDGCDPVVVDNDLAYITVRSGNLCGQDINELFIVDVTDVNKPSQPLVHYAMNNPKGLGIDSDRQILFLCDDGLKAFRITDDPQTLIANKLTHLKGMDGYDLIPYNDILMMIADDGLYQYDYSDPENIRQISVIPVYQNNN